MRVRANDLGRDRPQDQSNLKFPVKPARSAFTGRRGCDAFRRINAWLVAGVLLGVAGVAINPPHPVLAASPTLTAPPSRNALLAPGRLVNPRALPAVTPSSAAIPFRPKDPASFWAHHQLAASATGRRSGVMTAPAAQAVAGGSAPQIPQKLAGFPVMDLMGQISAFGGDQDVQPPDTQLAAGPTSLAEAVNSSLSIWSKSGTRGMTSDLNAFFNVPVGFGFGDPRILYDAESGRWFLSGLANNSTTNDSQIYIAVSTTSDPAGSWRFTMVKSQTAVIADQPMIGVNSDKVVISWNDYSGATTPAFSGEETWVLEKSDLVSGAAAHYTAFGPDVTRFRLVPSQSLTSSTTEWLAYNFGAAVGVVAITGLPSAGSVVFTEYDPAFQPTNLPPFPQQPSGVAVTQDIDDRFLSAVWQSGTLWVSATDACIPAGDSIARACLRLVGISTGGSSPAVVQDFDTAQAGTDLYYPAVTLNSSGDLFVGYSESSSTIYPSAMAADSLAASPSAFENPIVLAQGLASYAQAPANRWGDYSAAAPDPTNPAEVWVTAEYEASATMVGNWGTATGRLAIQPSITTVTPGFGPPAGGTSVTISGSHFQAGAAVSFGSIAATNVVVVSSQQITAATPAAGSSGPVDVTVANPDGAAGTASSAYTYTTAPVVTSVAPNSGSIAGGTSVTLTGGNFTGATAVTFGATPATEFTVDSDAHITVVSPAHGVSWVDVTVTAPSGTSAPAVSDRFTYTLMSLYFTWYDLASPGMLNDNIHLINGSGSLANISVSMPGANPIRVVLRAGQETIVSFGQGHIGGPVVINSDQQIQASQRVQYYQTFNEVWAEGAPQASTTSYFNWFDKASPGMLNDNIHLLNPGSASATVSVSLPGLTPQMATIAPGAEAYFSFPKGTIGGPITVTSSQPVLATQRVQYYSSFKEVWAEGAAQAAATTYLNWYDKASPGMSIDNIHVIDPGSTGANVTVSLPGATDQVLTVPAGGEANVSFPAGTIGGPIVVRSTQPVLASQRVVYYATFNEVWAESAGQAATTSRVTWYDKASPGMFNDNFHILNPGTVSANVMVSLAGAPTQSVLVAAGGESFVSFPPGTIGGPVTVTSDHPVLASQRVQYYSSFNEIWAA